MKCWEGTEHEGYALSFYYAPCFLSGNPGVPPGLLAKPNARAIGYALRIPKKKAVQRKRPAWVCANWLLWLSSNKPNLFLICPSRSMKGVHICVPPSYFAYAKQISLSFLSELYRNLLCTKPIRAFLCAAFIFFRYERKRVLSPYPFSLSTPLPCRAGRLPQQLQWAGRAVRRVWWQRGHRQRRHSGALAAYRRCGGIQGSSRR